jgi:catechol 2,3-dioxygenase-like lactoylglutathione lyase family enzyme
MPDIGFTHVALPVANLEASIAFYAKYANMRVVHRRAQQQKPEREVAWLSDLTRPFVLVLAEMPPVVHRLGPFAHLGVACTSREEVDRLCELARVEGCLRDAPSGGTPPVGYYANLDDPDGHTLELSFGQEIGLTLDQNGPVA